MKPMIKYASILCFFVCLLHAVSDQNFDETLSYDLFDAIVRNDIVTLKKLLEEGANPNAMYEGKTALMIALYKANGQEALVIRELLKNGANPNLVDVSSMSPLEFAKKHNKGSKIIDLLLHYGAMKPAYQNPCTIHPEVACIESPLDETEKGLEEWELLPAKEEIKPDAMMQYSLWDTIKYYLGLK
jgi:hypothetical protein